MARTFTIRAGVVLAVAGGLVVAASAGGATRPPIQLNGTATFQQIVIPQRCSFSTNSTRTILYAACTQIGAFAGRPARAGASYGWRWDLEVGTDGRTTGNGPEVGELAFNFGTKLGILRVTTRGQQAPVGTPDANHAVGKTTGTWRYKSGTKRFAKRRGTGTYTFDTERTGPDTFQVARITLRGTLR